MYFYLTRFHNQIEVSKIHCTSITDFTTRYPKSCNDINGKNNAEGNICNTETHRCTRA